MSDSEYISLIMKYFQSILTISSLFLGFVPTYVEKVLNPKDKIKKKKLATTSIFSFLIAVVSIFLAQIGLTFWATGVYNSDLIEVTSFIQKGSWLASVFQYIAWTSFLVGIITLAIFLQSNLANTFLGKSSQ